MMAFLSYIHTLSLRPADIPGSSFKVHNILRASRAMLKSRPRLICIFWLLDCWKASKMALQNIISCLHSRLTSNGYNGQRFNLVQNPAHETSISILYFLPINGACCYRNSARRPGPVTGVRVIQEISFLSRSTCGDPMRTLHFADRLPDATAQYRSIRHASTEPMILSFTRNVMKLF